MGRMPCCEKVEVKKGPWTPEEDKKLLAYVQKHGHGNWRLVPAKAGLQRCGKSCRLRWINYLKPDIKRGNFTSDEDRTIIQLHALLGNKWSIIAAHLPRRTDNEIKNYWNTNVKKRLIRMGLDPITHKPVKSNSFQAYGGGCDQFKDTDHLAQWESVRINAEARESMLQVGSGSSHRPRLILSKIPTNKPCYSSHSSLSTQHNAVYNMYALVLATNHDLPQGCFPVSTLRIPDGEVPVFSTNVEQCTDDNVKQTSNETQKVMEDYVSNLQDDEGCFPVYTLRIPDGEVPVFSTNVEQCTDDNVKQTSNETQKIMEDYVSNLQDDDIMVAMEAFRTARFESIQELFNCYSSMEGLINC